MEFVIYCYTVSLMPGGAWRQFRKIWRFGDIFGENECSRNLKPRAYNINRKRGLPECSRSIGEIVNFACQATL